MYFTLCGGCGCAERVNLDHWSKIERLGFLRVFIVLLDGL